MYPLRRHLHWNHCLLNELLWRMWPWRWFVGWISLAVASKGASGLAFGFKAWATFCRCEFPSDQDRWCVGRRIFCKNLWKDSNRKVLFFHNWILSLDYKEHKTDWCQNLIFLPPTSVLTMALFFYNLQLGEPS